MNSKKPRNRENRTRSIPAEATVTAVLGNEVLSEKYEAYVISVPIPKLNEKNACPIARNTTPESIFEKSG